MATLFHQRATRETTELVPLPDFVEEWHAVFGHADRFNLAECASFQSLVNRLAVDRLVPILQANLEDAFIGARYPCDLPSISDCRRHGFFDENVLARFSRDTDDIDMRVVGRANDDAVDSGIRAGLFQAGIHLQRFVRVLRMCNFRVFDAERLRVVNAVDRCASFEARNADMLLAHCSGANTVESVAGRLLCKEVFVLLAHQVRMAVTAGEIATPELFSLGHRWNSWPYYSPTGILITARKNYN